MIRIFSVDLALDSYRMAVVPDPPCRTRAVGRGWSRSASFALVQCALESGAGAGLEMVCQVSLICKNSLQVRSRALFILRSCEFYDVT